MKIAVVGSGISGLGVAHFLSKKHKVDLFEKEDHFGGHAYTVEIPANNQNNSVNTQIGTIMEERQNAFEEAASKSIGNASNKSNNQYSL